MHGETVKMKLHTLFRGNSHFKRLDI